MDQNQRISQLEELVSEILLKIDRISQDVSTQRTAQLQLMKAVLRQSDSIEYLIVQQTALREEFAVLRGEFTEIRADQRVLRAEFAVMREDVGTLKEDVGTLKTNFDVLRGEFAQMRQSQETLREEFLKDKTAKDEMLETILKGLQQLLGRE